MKRSCADKTAQRVISVCKSTLCLLLLVAVFLATAKSAISAPPLFFGGKQKPKAEGLNRIPMDRLDADAREKVLSVINHTSVYRKMTPQMIDCDPRYYMFLIRHPEVIVGIWQLMDATEMTITRDGPGRFTATDGAGTIGNLEFLYGDQKVHILYGKGSYTGNLTKRPIRADCLLVLHTEFVPHESGRQYVRSKMDLYVDVKNVGVDLIARTFQNLIGNTTEQNFVETASFVTKLSRTTEENGPGVQHLASRLVEVDDDVRNEFALHAGTVYRRALLRNHTAKATNTAIVKETPSISKERR